MTRQLPKAARFQRVRRYLATLPSGMPTSSAYLVAGMAIVVPILTAGTILPAIGHGMLERDPGGLPGRAVAGGPDEVALDDRSRFPQASSPPVAPGRDGQGSNDPRHGSDVPTPTLGTPQDPEPSETPGAAAQDRGSERGDRDSDDRANESPRANETASSARRGQPRTEPSESPSGSDRDDGGDEGSERDRED